MDAQHATPAAGERKPVTALFADVVDSTRLAESMDPEDWAVVVNRLYEVADASIGRYDGTVTQLSGDAIVALFGAPVAHEDDPERAVRAALDLVDAVPRLSEQLREELGADLQIRVGVNTGVAVVGRVGGPGHAEYTALGDAINVAARMQTAARPGTVLVTRATHDRVADLVDTVALGAIPVKGKSEPVSAYEVTAITQGATRTRGIPGLSSPMVGRDEELQRLTSLLDVVEAGRGRMALVIGEPGIGKSRLLAELRQRWRGARWIEAHSVSYGRSRANHLIGDLVDSMVGGDHTAAALDRLTAELLGVEGDRVAGHLAHMIGLPVPADVAASLEGLDPAAVRRRHVEALRAVLTAMARSTPLVIACEDLHWADASSVGALVELIPLVDDHPILLLATCRPDRDAEGWRLVNQARLDLGDALTEVRLEALSLGDSRTLVAHLLEIESLPGHIRQRILARTDGNPFFLEEVVRALIDEGLITRRGARWVASREVSAVHVPETVHGLLLARTDRLPGDARRCLQVASVIGRTFSTTLLGAITGGSIEVLRELGVLEAHGLVRVEATTPELTYAFRHALVQEAAYAGLLRRERQALHRRLADLLVARPGPETVELLAHHLDLAGEPDRALPYLLEAGQQALVRYANREAHARFQRAGELLRGRTDPAARRRRVEAGLGEIEAGDTFVPAHQQLALLGDLATDAEALGDDRLTARVHYWIGWIRHAAGEWYARSPQLRASIERARELGARLGDETLVALPLGVIGSADYAAGRFHQAIAGLGPAVDVLERRERLADAAVFAAMATMAAARLGTFADADAWLARSKRLAERSGDPNALLDADLAAGILETERGNVLAAMEHTRRAIDQATEVGNVACALVGSFFLGDQHLRLGDAAAAIPPLEQSSDLATYCDAGAFADLSQAWLAAARAGTGGDLDAELAALSRSLQTARANGDAMGEGLILRHLATVRAAGPRPDWTAVFADLDAAIEVFERLDARPALARVLHEYGMALPLAGRDAEATAMLQRARELFEAMAIPAAA